MGRYRALMSGWSKIARPYATCISHVDAPPGTLNLSEDELIFLVCCALGGMDRKWPELYACSRNRLLWSWYDSQPRKLKIQYDAVAPTHSHSHISFFRL
jgi:hypothetical protein